MREMRASGNTSGVALFRPQRDLIIEFLVTIGVTEIGMNGDLIELAIRAHQNLGNNGFEVLLARAMSGGHMRQ